MGEEPHASRVGALWARGMHVALGAPLAFLAGYLVGSVPLGLLVARAVSGIDIRRYGTGGVGASNVRQNVGTLWAAIVMLGLFLQGLLPPLAVRLAGVPEATVVAAALGAVVGYSWSVFLGFKVEGARGVGISTGAAAVLCPGGLLPLYSACALGALLRQGSVGVLVGFVLYAGWAAYFADSVAYAAGAFALLALVVVRRLEGVREDLRRGTLLPVVVDRLLFDRRPGRLAGSAEEGRP